MKQKDIQVSDLSELNRQEIIAYLSEPNSIKSKESDYNDEVVLIMILKHC